MSTDKLKVRCPKCGKILSVANVAGVEQKHFTCTICQTRSKVGDCIVVQSSDRTQYSNTIINNKVVPAGSIVVVNTGQTFQLQPGRNVIGRKAQSSTATIQIDCMTNKMSREHLVIDVTKIGNGYQHVVSLYKPETNETRLNGQIKLGPTSKIVLQHGTIINLPGADVRFEIPDDDRTELG